jgi:meso-butanediol dehydrogenase/(S,S)-butanediol dehydrogenase/diacetyl reductase
MGKVALVTGGANGIGAAIVARLAKEGAKVLVADRTKPAAVSDSIRYIQTDATKGEDAAVAITTALEMWGRLDILVNNAGVGAYGETPDMDEKLWDQVFAINIRAIFLFCHAAIPAMLENGGAIVNGGLQCLQGGGGELHPQPRTRVFAS